MQGLQLSSTLSASERAEALKLRFADLINKSNNPNKNIVRNEDETLTQRKKKNSSCCPADGNLRKEEEKKTTTTTTTEVADDQKIKNHNLQEVKKSLIKINLKATEKKINHLNGAENKKKRPLIVQEQEEEENNNHMTKKLVVTKTKQDQEVVKKESKIEAERRASREKMDNMKMTYDFEENKKSMIQFDKLLNLPPQNYYYYSRDTFFAEFYP